MPCDIDAMQHRCHASGRKSRTSNNKIHAHQLPHLEKTGFKRSRARIDLPNNKTCTSSVPPRQRESEVTQHGTGDAESSRRVFERVMPDGYGGGDSTGIPCEEP